ncbi:transposase [Paenibacillus psychroresistens]|uniref:transposase n=1 Tax=Paenibacillus psychroresistens TaxID=1778678 RepID=UPI001390E921|nr:transposase [Paenibacillus psychroresistens]
MFKDLTTEFASLVEFQARFYSEEACADYLFAQKWPCGFICSRCSHTLAFRIDTRRLPLYQCIHCHYQASPTVGTIMESSSTDLRKWFTALFLVSSTESSVHALRLSKLIQVTYKTAWLMLRKIRQSITQADHSVKLTGTVYVDEGKCGKPWTNNFYFEADEFPVLVGIAIDDQNQPTYVKIQMVPKSDYTDTDILPRAICAFHDTHVDDEATMTHSARVRMKRKDMRGYPTFKKAKTWIKKTFRGLAQHHLQHYWNEFCWRVNSKFHNQSPFESLLNLCAFTPSSLYANLVK